MILFLLTYFVFGVFTILAAIFNWFTFNPTKFGMAESKGLWGDIKLASMIGLPVWNWAVAVTTVLYWIFPEKSK